METKSTATIKIAISALFFALGGIFIKLVPWSSFSIQAVRCFFALPVMLIYMRMTNHKFIVNRAVLLIAVANTAMSTTYVMANKLTTAANAVVLHFTEPLFVIFLVWIVWKKRPDKEALIACILAFIGIVFFFLDDLSYGNVVGNLVAIFSGFCYTGVFLGKTFKDSDFESGIVLSYILNVFLWGWSLTRETVFTPKIWIIMIAFGVLQYSLSYIFLSQGLDHVSAVTASLISMLEPVTNPILVAIFYGELIGKTALVGAVIVLGSVTWYSVHIAKENEPNKKEQDDVHTGQIPDRME